MAREACQVDAEMLKHKSPQSDSKDAPWSIVVATATSDASVLTSKGMLSSMADANASLTMFLRLSNIAKA